MLAEEIRAFTSEGGKKSVRSLRSSNEQSTA